MKRTLDATRLNEIANHPEVRPWLGGNGAIDLTAFASNPENFAFLSADEGGAHVFHKKALGFYEVHTLSLPEGRNRAMVNCRNGAFRAMFLTTDATEIVTLVPDGNKGAGVWANHAGFREVFRREGAFNLMGEKVGVSYRSLTYADWVLWDKENRGDGEDFHAFIHQYTPDDHGADPVHDAWAGATIDGCRQGNGAKCVGLYNRWTLHSGYEPISVLSLTPLCLDIRSAIIEVKADGLNVLSVREARSAPLPIEELESTECPSQPLAQA